MEGLGVEMLARTGLVGNVALPSQALAIPQQELVKTSKGVSTRQVHGDGDKPTGSLQGCLKNPIRLVGGNGAEKGKVATMVS